MPTTLPFDPKIHDLVDLSSGHTVRDAVGVDESLTFAYIRVRSFTEEGERRETRFYVAGLKIVRKH